MPSSFDLSPFVSRGSRWKKSHKGMVLFAKCVAHRLICAGNLARISPQSLPHSHGDTFAWMWASHSKKMSPLGWILSLSMGSQILQEVKLAFEKDDHSHLLRRFSFYHAFGDSRADGYRWFAPSCSSWNSSDSSNNWAIATICYFEAFKVVIDIHIETHLADLQLTR